MHDEPREQPTGEPTLQQDFAKSERRILVQLAARRQLAASVVGRLSARPIARRELALAGQRRLGVRLPLAVSHALLRAAHNRRERDSAAVERFWWRRMAPYAAMLRRHRPRSPLISWTTGFSRSVDMVGAQAESALDYPVSDSQSDASEDIPEVSAAAQRRPATSAAPTLRGAAAATARVHVGASGVWARLAAVLRPQSMGSPPNAPAGEVNRGSAPPAPTIEQGVSASAPPRGDASASTRRTQTSASRSSPFGASAADAHRLEVESPAPALHAQGVAGTPTDEIAPLASRLTRRLDAPLSVIASATQIARPSPTKVFWWPGATTPGLRERGSAVLQGFAPEPPAMRRAHIAGAPANQAPGLLGRLLQVHRAATSPVSRVVHFLRQAQHAPGFATSGAAEMGRWRVRSALAARDSDGPLDQLDGAAETPAQPSISGAEAASEATAPQAAGTARRLGGPTIEDRGQHQDDSRTAPSGHARPAPYIHRGWAPMPVVRGFVGRLRRLARSPRVHGAVPPVDPDTADPASVASVQIPQALAMGTPRPLASASPGDANARTTLGPAPVCAFDSRLPARSDMGTALGGESGALQLAQPGFPRLAGAGQSRGQGFLERARRGFAPASPRGRSQSAIQPGEAPTRVLPHPPVAQSPAGGPPYLLPRRPSQASDAELAEVIRRLPGPMAAAALAAGVLGEAAGQAALERSEHAQMSQAPATGSRARPDSTADAQPPTPYTQPPTRHAQPPTRYAQPLTQYAQWPPQTRYASTWASPPLDPLEFAYAPPAEWSSAAPTPRAGIAASLNGGLEAISEQAWSAPLDTQHARMPNLGSSSSSTLGGGGSSSALAAGGFAAAPLERDAAPSAAPAVGPGAATAQPGGGHESHASGSASAPAPTDLDHLAEEVLNKLRWRLAVERERLMG